MGIYLLITVSVYSVKCLFEDLFSFSLTPTEALSFSVGLWRLPQNLDFRSAHCSFQIPDLTKIHNILKYNNKYKGKQIQGQTVPIAPSRFQTLQKYTIFWSTTTNTTENKYRAKQCPLLLPDYRPYKNTQFSEVQLQIQMKTNTGPNSAHCSFQIPDLTGKHNIRQYNNKYKGKQIQGPNSAHAPSTFQTLQKYTIFCNTTTHTKEIKYRDK